MTEKERLEFEKRKTEAEKRLNEMYYGSGKKDPAKGLKVPSFISAKQESNSKNEENHTPKITKSNPTKSGGLLSMFNFKGIEMDNDRLLILAVCLLLLGDSDDELLMLALLYIML